MADVIEVERSSDNTARSFSPDQMSDGTMYDWITAQKENADGRVSRIQDLSGNSRNLSSTARYRPYVVKNGYLITENGRPTLRFEGEGSYYSKSIPSSTGRVIAVRAKPDYLDTSHVLADADGLRITENRGTITAELIGEGSAVSLDRSDDQSTHVVAACDGSTLYLNVEGTTTSTSYSGSRTQDGTLDVANASGGNSFQGTIQQIYIWDEEKSTGEQSDILSRLDEPFGTPSDKTDPRIWDFSTAVKPYIIDNWQRGSDAWYFDGEKFQKETGHTPRHATDPETGRQYLLAEPQRAQMLGNPQDQTGSAWSTYQATPNKDVGTAKGVSYDSLIEDTNSGKHLTEDKGISSNSGVAIALSMIVKANGRNWCGLRFEIQNVSTERPNFQFDLANGETGSIRNTTTHITVLDHSIRDLGGGWYRAQAAVDLDSGWSAHQYGINLLKGENNSWYTGDGSSGIYVMHAQAEVGRFVTSPIFNGGATRAPDDLSNLPFQMPSGDKSIYFRVEQIAGGYDPNEGGNITDAELNLTDSNVGSAGNGLLRPSTGIMGVDSDGIVEAVINTSDEDIQGNSTTDGVDHLTIQPDKDGDGEGAIYRIYELAAWADERSYEEGRELTNRRPQPWTFDSDKLLQPFQRPASKGAFFLREIENGHYGRTVEVERLSDEARKDFTAKEIVDGTLENWADGAEVKAGIIDDMGPTENDLVANNWSNSRGNAPSIAKDGVLVTLEDRPAVHFAGDDDIKQQISVRNELTVALDFESAYGGSYPMVVYKHDGLKVRETTTDVEVEITDGTNTETVAAPKLDVNRVVVTTNQSQLNVRVNGEDYTATHSISRSKDDTFEIGHYSFEGQMSSATVFDDDKWGDRSNIIDDVGGVWSPPSRVRWDFGQNNVIDNSEDLTGGNWGIDATLDGGTNHPLGLPNNKVVPDTTNQWQEFDQKSYLTSGKYIFEFDVKAGGYKWVRTEVAAGSDKRFQLWVNAENGMFGTVDTPPTEKTISPLGDGWYRVRIKFDVPADKNHSRSPNIAITESDNGGAFTGDGTSGMYFTRFRISKEGVPYKTTGDKAQSLAPDVGPSKLAFSVGSDDTAEDTNDPYITPDGVKGDGTDDYLTQESSELAYERDFTVILRLNAPNDGDWVRHIKYGATDSSGFALYTPQDDRYNLRVVSENQNLNNQHVAFIDGTDKTIAFSIGKDRQTFRYYSSYDSGSFQLSDLYRPPQPSNDDLVVLADRGGSSVSAATVKEIEMLDRALSVREMKAATRAITESEKRNSLSRVYPTYAWDFQESADNLLWNSDSVVKSGGGLKDYWSKYHMDFTQGAATTPDGTTADKWVPTTDDSYHFVYPTEVYYETGTHITSVVAKQDGYSKFVLRGPETTTAKFDLSSGAVLSQSSGVDDTKVTDLGNGWYRCEIEHTIDNSLYAEENIRVFAVAPGGSSVSSGDGTSGILVAKLQVKKGTFGPYVSKGPKQQHVDSKIGGAPQIQLGSTAGADTNDPTWTAEGLKGDGVDDYATVTDASLNPANDFSWVIAVKDAVIANQRALDMDDGQGWNIRSRGKEAWEVGFSDSQENTSTLELTRTITGNLRVIGFSLLPDGNTTYGTIDGQPVIKEPNVSFDPASNNELRTGSNFNWEGQNIDVHFYDTALSPEALLSATKELYRKRT